jgi:predicted transcriptional regulator
MKTPCEIIVWNIVPVIRKEFAKNLIENHGLNQKKVADKLGISESAVSRYISGKRGVLEITDNEILEEIRKSTDIIAKENGSAVIEETCKICKLLQSKQFIEGIKKPNNYCGVI